ncbi:MAG: hypothetical protein ACQCN6_01815 [Candidatus Bathyarchaeia archaeon]|jgi:hypothetical protein
MALETKAKTPYEVWNQSATHSEPKWVLETEYLKLKEENKRLTAIIEKTQPPTQNDTPRVHRKKPSFYNATYCKGDGSCGDCLLMSFKYHKGNALFQICTNEAGCSLKGFVPVYAEKKEATR